MQEVIRANALYWLRILQNASNDRPLPETDLRGAAKAIEATLRIAELWDVTKALAQALHPYMEQCGLWAEWDDFLQVLAERARQQSDGQAEAEILLRRGVIQRQRGDFPSAMISSRQAWQFYRHGLGAKNQSALAAVYSQLGDAYRLRGRFWRAEPLCIAAVLLFESENNIPELARAENRLGLIHFDQLNYPAALSCFLRSETLWRQVSDLHGLAKVLHNLGELHRRSKELEKALAYLQEAARHYLATGDQVHTARIYLDIGNVYLNRGELSQAESIYLQVERTLRRAGESRDLATVRHNLGIVYTRLGIWDQAEACFVRALEQWHIREDIWRESNTLGEMGMLYFAQGNRMMARSYLYQARRLIRKHSGAHFEVLREELAERLREVAA